MLAALFLGLAIEVIIEYSLRFSAKTGLIKAKTRDITNTFQYLKSNAQTIALRPEFDLQQANIFAFDLASLYAPYAKSAANKLDLANELMDVL